MTNKEIKEETEKRIKAYTERKKIIEGKIKSCKAIIKDLKEIKQDDETDEIEDTGVEETDQILEEEE